MYCFSNFLLNFKFRNYVIQLGVFLALASVVMSCSDADPSARNKADQVVEGNVTWESKMKSEFTTKCGDCHDYCKTLDGVKSKLDGDNGIKARILKNNMPPSGGLDQATNTSVLAWINAGLP
jgi:hypothetical protein